MAEMQHEALSRLAWWSDHPVKLPARPSAVRSASGGIKQKNSSVLPYLLTLKNDTNVNVVAKVVDLHANSYRDQEHRSRSLQSYKVETNFYGAFADKLQKVGAKIPELLYQEWHLDDSALILVLEDLRGWAKPASNHATRLTHQTLGLDYSQAVLALKWLSKMHAACWGQSPTGIWPQGSYWSLEKRRNDLAKMPDQWSKTVSAFSAAFPGTFGRPSVQGLAGRLQIVADTIHAMLTSDASQHSSNPLHTIVHGDFKTANLFFHPTAEAASDHATSAEQGTGSVGVCDFQWCGGGLGVTDVMYVLWTSVQPHVIKSQQDDLLRVYHDCLQHELRQQHGSNGQTYSFKLFCHHYQLAYLDYVRFLIGSMWGSVTPHSCQQLSSDINQGMHKRSAEHLTYMIEKADQVLHDLESGVDHQHDLLLDLHGNRHLSLQSQH